MPSGAAWPELPVERWQPTRDTFILWLQVIGKVRIAHAPLLNHWWNAPHYVTSRGLTTSLIPAEPGRGFSIDPSRGPEVRTRLRECHPATR